MTATFVSFAERPELWDQIEDLSSRVWPEYNLHGDVTGEHWGRLYEDFPDFQFVLYDEPTAQVLCEGHTIPCSWDGSVDGLPEGIDAVLLQGLELLAAGRRPNALSALAAEVLPEHRDKRLSSVILEKMRDIAARHALANLIAPVRPSLKARYPITPIEDYVYWTRPDGQPFDPWIRVHTRMGADILKPIPSSLLITGTVAEWESWTAMAFPATGDYVFPEGLAPVAIDRDADRGTYWEPNVWIRHPV